MKRCITYNLLFHVPKNYYLNGTKVPRKSKIHPVSVGIFREISR